MKHIVAGFVIAFTLFGCSDSDKFLEDERSNVQNSTNQEIKKEAIATKEIDQPTKEEVEAAKEEVEAAKEAAAKEAAAKEAEEARISNLVLPSKDRSFSAIKKLIRSSGNGIINDATYICVGDSTRANSHYEGVYIFTQVRDRLNDYGVESQLHAKAGHTAREFNKDGSSPTWKDVVYDIPSDGRSTIVDISLGINDSWGGHSNFKYYLRSAINKIKSYKPNTHFMLTMPDRVYGDSDMTNKIKQQYQELSYELNIPLINIVEDIMPSQDSTSYSLYRHDGFNVHLSREGQRRVANDILLHILPN